VALFIFLHSKDKDMTWKGLFEGIQSIAEGSLFMPFNALRSLELEDWFGANIMTWFFLAIGFTAFAYWMLQLKKFNDNNEEDRSSTSHAYLGGDKYN
jgi:hypothetical protein